MKAIHNIFPFDSKIIYSRDLCVPLIELKRSLPYYFDPGIPISALNEYICSIQIAIAQAIHVLDLGVKSKRAYSRVLETRNIAVQDIPWNIREVDLYIYHETGVQCYILEVYTCFVSYTLTRIAICAMYTVYQESHVQPSVKRSSRARVRSFAIHFQLLFFKKFFHCFIFVPFFILLFFLLILFLKGKYGSKC